MGELREFWANVYEGPEPDLQIIGERWPSLRKAYDIGRQSLRSFGESPIYRIHVRLKPDGAPKRYRNDMERRGWETEPATMRRVAKIVEANSGLFRPA